MIECSGFVSQVDRRECLVCSVVIIQAESDLVVIVPLSLCQSVSCFGRRFPIRFTVTFGEIGRSGETDLVGDLADVLLGGRDQQLPLFEA